MFLNVFVKGPLLSKVIFCLSSCGGKEKYFHNLLLSQLGMAKIKCAKLENMWNHGSRNENLFIWLGRWQLAAGPQIFFLETPRNIFGCVSMWIYFMNWLTECHISLSFWCLPSVSGLHTVQCPKTDTHYPISVAWVNWLEDPKGAKDEVRGTEVTLTSFIQTWQFETYQLTSPEAQRTQGIDSLPWVSSPVK